MFVKKSVKANGLILMSLGVDHNVGFVQHKNLTMGLTRDTTLTAFNIANFKGSKKQL